MASEAGPNYEFPPGPWHAGIEEMFACRRYAVYTSGGAVVVLLGVVGPTEWEPGKGETQRSRDRDAAESAKARLLAAAPQMVEALGPLAHVAGSARAPRSATVTQADAQAAVAAIDAALNGVIADAVVEDDVERHTA